MLKKGLGLLFLVCLLGGCSTVGNTDHGRLEAPQYKPLVNPGYHQCTCTGRDCWCAPKG